MVKLQRVEPSEILGTQFLVSKSYNHLKIKQYIRNVLDIKRIIGRTYNDKVIQDDITNWPFCVVNINGKPKIKVIRKNEEILYYPEQISALILQKLKEIAIKRVETPITKAVITVPAYFNDSQRQATKDAGKLAGLEVIRLLNEPTAAAIAYALDKDTETVRTALIFDLGGGTFDVSIIQFERQSINVKAIDGDSHLGGNDFTNRLLEHVLKSINEQYNVDVRSNRSGMSRLLAACERIKQLLSFHTVDCIDLPALINGEDFYMEISQAKFDDLNEDLFQKIIEIVQNCLNCACILPTEIDDVVLVGGSTRIPRIQNLLQELFRGKTLCNSMNPDEAVAIGAAIHGGFLSNNYIQEVKRYELKDVVPISLGVETAGGVMNTLIKRNTPLPVTASKTFTTSTNNQSSISIKIFEGEESLTKDNHFLGKLKVTGINSAPKGRPRIDETFYIDEDGILSVSATEREAGRTLMLNINLFKGRLEEKEIIRIINENVLNKEKNDKHLPEI